MNILHVNMSLDPVTGGGTVERVRQLHESMRNIEGVTSQILSVAVGEGGAGVEGVVLLPCWSRRWYLPAPKLVMIYHMVRQADVVHLMNHWTVLNAIVYWMSRVTGTPYVVCPAGALSLFGRSQGFKQWYNKLVGWSLVEHAAAAIAISQEEVSILKQYGLPERRIYHIPNGVRLNDFACTEEDLFREYAGVGSANYLLFVGRLNEIKGPDILLDAFIDLSAKFPDLHLVFAGPDGGMLDRLKEKTVKESLQGRVHFTGYAAGDLKSSAYHGASLLVVPSRQEAMSIVALEGAVCATPVVLTDACGFDALANAGAAKLTEASSDAISMMVGELISDPDLLLEMGEKGQQFALKFYTWDIAAQRHFELFAQCVDGTV